MARHHRFSILDPGVLLIALGLGSAALVACAAEEAGDDASGAGTGGTTGGTSAGTAGSGTSGSSGSTSAGGAPLGGSAGSTSGASGSSGAGGAGTSGGGAGAGGAGAGGAGAGGTSGGGAGAGGTSGGAGGTSGAGAGGGGAGAGGAGGNAGMSGGGSGGASGSSGAGGSGGGGAFTLTSSKIDPEQEMPSDFTCEGEGHSPPFEWTGVPEGTMSFAMVFVDRTIIDANPTSPMGWHSAIWDIPASVTSLPEDLPEGANLTTPVMAKQYSPLCPAYLGPCANKEDLYEFRLYALPVATLTGMTNSVLNINNAIMAANPLGEAKLTVRANASGSLKCGD